MSTCSDQRSTNLITYSRADLDKVSSREEFADIWVKAFGLDLVKQWACCCEKHKESDEVHFHLAIKLNRVKRWKMVRDQVIRESGIVCHFQEFHTNYYDAFKYIKKEDCDFIMSDGHPNLENSPQTKKASAKTAKRNLIFSAADLRTQQPKQKKSKIEKLDIVKVYDIIINNNLHTEQDLFLLAHSQKAEGKTDLLDFILRMSEKRRSELLRTAWKVDGAAGKNKRQQKTAMEILTEHRISSKCVCNGDYAKCATEILTENNIDIIEFKCAVIDALCEGRKKGNNIMIIGPANCGKTFILRPLTEVFDCFVSPACGTFAWVGAEKAEVIFLNDLRWNDKLMPWQEFLNLLEGFPIHLQAPKTHYSEDILWDKKTPIFATSSQKIRKYDNNLLNDVETTAMAKRWKYYSFSREIQSPKEIQPCATCFANFMLSL